MTGRKMADSGAVAGSRRPAREGAAAPLAAWPLDGLRGVLWAAQSGEVAEMAARLQRRAERGRRRAR